VTLERTNVHSKQKTSKFVRAKENTTQRLNQPSLTKALAVLSVDIWSLANPSQEGGMVTAHPS
jgi:hypothetical protein